MEYAALRCIILRSIKFRMNTILVSFCSEFLCLYDIHVNIVHTFEIFPRFVLNILYIRIVSRSLLVVSSPIGQQGVFPEFYQTSYSLYDIQLDLFSNTVYGLCDIEE